MFQHPGAHLKIASMDAKQALEVIAQYNPKELNVGKQVPWAQQTKDVGKDWIADGKLALHYGGNQPRTLQLELTFDTYEDGDGDKTWVRTQIETLEELASPIEPGSEDDARRRAHICLVVWGGGLPKFVCVIEQLQTKYSVFDREGYPLRATSTINLKEVNLKEMLDLEQAENRVRVENKTKPQSQQPDS